MNEVQPPVVGWVIGSGQLEMMGEDGVATAPIISIGFVRVGEDPEGVDHYTVGAPMVDELAKALTSAGDHSMQQWDPRWREYEEKYQVRRRREMRFFFTVYAAFAVLYILAQGFAASHPYLHHGGILEGFIGGLNALWQMLGIVSMMFLGRAVGRWAGRRKAAKQSGATPPEVAPLDDRL